MDNDLIHSLERQLLTFMADPFNRPSSSFMFGRRSPSPSPSASASSSASPSTSNPRSQFRTSHATTQFPSYFARSSASSAASPPPPTVADQLFTLIHEYQQSFVQYQTNMSSLITLLETHLNHSPEQSPPSPIQVPREPTHPEIPRLRRSRNTQSVLNPLLADNLSSPSLNNILLSYYFHPRGGGTVGDDISPLQQLTQTQIAENTRNIRYDGSMNDARCPITMDDFSEGEEVLQINGCGHYFKTDALLEWFRRNSHCPVCRHDITQNAQRRVFTSTTTNAHDAYSADTDADTDVDEITTNHFTFEIPMYVDASNNLHLNETTPLLSTNNEVERAFGRELLSALSSYMGRQI